MIHMTDHRPLGEYRRRAEWPRRLFWTAASFATAYLWWQALPGAFRTAMVMR